MTAAELTATLTRPLTAAVCADLSDYAINTLRETRTKAELEVIFAEQLKVAYAAGCTYNATGLDSFLRARRYGDRALVQCTVRLSRAELVAVFAQLVARNAL